MRKRMYLSLVALPMMVSLFSGCSSLHVHTINSPYEYNETSHWKTCKVCHQKFDEHEHVFNEFNDKCFICDYIDPLVYLNEQQEVIGLTPHGKEKLTFDVPNTVNDVPVKGIASGAFAGSKAITVKLNRDLDYYYTDAFTGSNVRIINSEEGDLVQWVKEGDKMVKHRDYEAKIDKHYYETLKEAFDSIMVEDATITLLKDDIKIDPNEPINVIHSASLVSYQSSTALECNFNIVAPATLYIPETITYKGNTKLLLSEYDEPHGAGDSGKDGNTSEKVYDTGSLVFTNKEERPDNVNVSYVESFGEGVVSHPAVGAKQVVNELLIVPTNHYAFGTFRFSKDFTEIKGLTEYGQTVTDLNITNVKEGVYANIAERSFSLAWDLKVPIAVIEDTHYYCFVPKGLFLNLTIGNGIKVVKKAAFNNRIDSDIDREIVNYLYPVFSHLFNITIGDTVEEIQYRAFYDSVALRSIGGGASLKKIGESAFEKSMNLTIVHFSEGSPLNEIKSKAFAACRSLAQVILPTGSWKFNSDTYFPYDMTPERIAYFIAHSDGSGTWTKSPLESRPISYTTSTAKDSLGRFKKVAFTNDIATAISSCADGGEVYISNEYKGAKNIPMTALSKSLTVNAAPELKDITVGDENGITVNAGKYLALYNVAPKGGITLKANKTASAQEFKNIAGFAIKKGDDMEYPVKINYEGDESGTFDAIDNEVIVRERTYNAYGLFDFSLYYSGDEVNSHLLDLTNLGKEATTITFARQIELEEGKVAKVTLENGQLSGSGSITYAFLSDEVVSIGAQFFNNFTKLQEITLGNGITTIAAEAFKGCTNLKHVVLPNSLESIGGAAFSGCTSLLSVNIPDEITVVPSNCFDGCTSLSSVSFSDSGKLMRIDGSSFKNCKNLTSIYIPKSVVWISGEAFRGCESLSEVTFEENDADLSSLMINEWSFAGCTSLVSINLPMQTSGIGSNAFNGCAALESVYLPDDNHLIMIFNNAFAGCTNLASFRFGDNTTGWKAGGTPLSSEDLSNDSIAATYLKETYLNVDWAKGN